MAKTINVVPLVSIQYKGKSYGPSSNPFEMDEKTAKELILDGIVKEVAGEPAKRQTTSKPTEE